MLICETKLSKYFEKSRKCKHTKYTEVQEIIQMTLRTQLHKTQKNVYVNFLNSQKYHIKTLIIIPDRFINLQIQDKSI